MTTKTIAIERLRRDDGQALVEYTLILMLIALVAFATLELIGSGVDAILDKVAAGFNL